MEPTHLHHPPPSNKERPNLRDKSDADNAQLGTEGPKPSLVLSIGENIFLSSTGCVYASRSILQLEMHNLQPLFLSELLSNSQFFSNTMSGPCASKSQEVHEIYRFPNSPRAYAMGRGSRIWVPAILIRNLGLSSTRTTCLFENHRYLGCVIYVKYKWNC